MNQQYIALQDAAMKLFDSCINCHPKMNQCGEPCSYHKPLYDVINNLSTDIPCPVCGAVLHIENGIEVTRHKEPV